MDPVAILKSVLEILHVTPTSVPAYVAWTAVGITALFILAGILASVREIARLWPKGWRPPIPKSWLAAIARIRFQNPIRWPFKRPSPLVEPLKSLVSGLVEASASGIDLEKRVRALDRGLAEEYILLILTKLERLTRDAHSMLLQLDPETRHQAKEWGRFSSRYWRRASGKTCRIVNADGSTREVALQELSELSEEGREKMFAIHPELRNLVVLIHEMYELGIAPIFEANSAPASEIAA